MSSLGKLFSGRPKITLLHKIAVFASGLVILLGLSVIVFIHVSLKDALVSELQAKGISLTQHFASMSGMHGHEKTYHNMRIMMSDYMKTNSDIEYIFISDPGGRVAAHSYDEELPVELKSLNSRFGDDPGIQTILMQEGQIHDIATPLPGGNGAALHIGFNEEQIDKTVRREVGILIGITIVILCLGIALSFLFANIITGPMLELMEVLKQVGQGRLNCSLHVRSNDEIGQLGRSFNKMICDLKETTITRDHLYNVINSMIDMVIVIDTDFIIKTVNRSTVQMLGYEDADIVGRDFHVICPAESIRTESAADLILNGHTSNIETYYEARGGDKIPVILSISVLQGSSHEQNVAVVVAKDITEHKQAEQKLRNYADKIHHSSEDLNMFLQIASHDLQEPLRKVQTLGDRLKMKFGQKIGVEGSLYLSRMQNAAKRMQSLINGLMLFSRITIKERNLKPVNLREITLEVVAELKSSIEQSGASVEIGELPVIEADSFQIRQLVYNLLANALKFRKLDERLCVRIYGNYIQGSGDIPGVERNNGKMYQFIVEDNGIGLDEKYLERIFIIFERLHNDDEYDGIGIGLAICKKIAELNGGAIDVSSKPGRGSRFTVTLPVRQPEEYESAFARKE